MHNWEALGWTDHDWSQLKQIAQQIANLSTALDFAIDSGPSELRPSYLSVFVDGLQQSTRQLQVIRSDYREDEVPYQKTSNPKKATVVLLYEIPRKSEDETF